MRKIILIILILFVLTTLAVLLADSTLLRNITGRGLPSDDKEAVKKILANTLEENSETDTKGILEYIGTEKEFKSKFEGKSTNLKKDSETDVKFEVERNSLIFNLPFYFDLKFSNKENSLSFNVSFSALWFNIKDLIFNVSPEAVLSSKKGPSETIEGKNYPKYEFELDPKVVFKIDNKNLKISGTILADSKKLVTKKKTINVLFVTSKGERIVFNREDLYSYNKPQAVIATPTEVIETVFSAEGLNILIRNITRKNDLKKIQAALEKYKEDKGNYPILASSSKDSDFLDFLKGTYLSDIPKDPNLGYYYRYESSDGKDYTLTSILENPFDKKGQKEGDLLLLRLNKIN